MYGRSAIAISSAVLLASCSVPNWFTRFVRTTEKMTWRHAPERRFERLPDVEPVMLSYFKAPAHSELLFSRGLLERLTKAGKPVIDVEFEAWSEFGRFKGYRIHSIKGVPYRSANAAPDAAITWGNDAAPHPVVVIFD